MLHMCCTLDLDRTVRHIAIKLEDKTVLARIAGGDLIAIEAQYDYNCLSQFKNHYRSVLRREHRESHGSNSEKIVQSRVLAELISYIEDNIDECTFVFKLSELNKLYEDRLALLDIDKTGNKSRVKDQLLAYMYVGEECQDQTDGKNTLCVFNEDLQQIFKSAVAARDFYEEAIFLSRVVRSVRRKIFNNEFFKFSGSFPDNCQSESVPTILKSLVSMLIYGNSINDQSAVPTQACLTICQLILFNSKQQVPEATNTRHTQDREPPLPVYVGLNVQTHTRSKQMLTRLYELGIRISYERFLEILDWFTAALCQRYQRESSVCPAQLRVGIFTVGVIDDIDHNLSSTTAEGSFHGTSLGIPQFPTNDNNLGESSPPIRIPPETILDVPRLPDSYAIVPDIVCNVGNVKVPEVVIPDTMSNIELAIRQEHLINQCLLIHAA